MKSPARNDLDEIYRRLFKKFGPQGWWPGRTKFEIIIGAVLTQNTNWGNVEKAIANLRREKVMALSAIHRIPVKTLAKLIRPSGYFNIKAQRLKNLVSFIFDEYGGSLKMIAAQRTAELRKKLLSVNGIGPETADSILLYAFNKPTFVVDAYTRRIFYRHNWVQRDADYHELQAIFLQNLPSDPLMFNEYHALIVRLGKDICRTAPRCDICPLQDFHYSLSHKCRGCHRAFLEREIKYHGKAVPNLCHDCRCAGLLA